MTGCSLRCSLSFIALALAAAPLHAGTIKVPSQHPTIQEGVDAAQAGDTVSVSKGVYNENVVINTAGITLKGSSATISGRYFGNCITITADDVTVENMILANGGGAPPVEGGPDTGGVLATGNGIKLTKLTISSCEDFGIRLVGTGGEVSSCKVDACLVRGIDVSTGDPEDPKSAILTLTIISKNTVTRCENGIRLEKGPFAVTSNTVSDNSNDGIEVNLGLGEIAGTEITKNKSTGNLGTGLIVNQPGEPAVNVLVEKNTMDENGVGVLLEGFNVDALSNTITDSVEDGLVVETNGLTTLDKNKVTNSGLVGIRVIGLNNTLTKNTVQNSGSDGIYVTGNTTTINDNTVKDGEGDGIQIALGVLSAVVANNTVSGNDHDGIDNSGTNAIIAENSSKKNGGADIAGKGNGGGTVIAGSSLNNVVSDDSDIVNFETVQELDMVQP